MHTRDTSLLSMMLHHLSQPGGVQRTHLSIYTCNIRTQPLKPGEARPPCPLQGKRVRFKLAISRPSSFTQSIPSVSLMGDMHSAVQELRELADFESVANAEGLISIGGFGSLLSEKSARYTFPALKNFRVARLSGFRRVFGHSAPVFFERGIANVETKEISSLSVEPCLGEFILLTLFEIGISEIPAFMEREHEFRFLMVFPESVDRIPASQPAVVCAHYSDEEYHEHRCKGSKDEFLKRYGRHGIDKIWRDDILPCRVYLRHCVLAAKSLGTEVFDNFLDHTYLGDRQTTIRKYLDMHAEIMKEEPPPLLQERYGG